MERKVLHGTIMGFATKDSKGGALVVKVEFPLTGVNAAYMVDIKGKNCRLDINPEEGQRELDIPDTSQTGLDFEEEEKPRQSPSSILNKQDKSDDQEEPEVDLDDEEELDDSFDDEPEEEDGLPDLDEEDPDTDYVDDPEPEEDLNEIEEEGI